MPVKIKSIEIERMRRFCPNATFHVGDHITLIAGENGTSKSTLLGMLCQPFHFGNLRINKGIVHSVYTENYNGFKLNEYITIPGTLFKSEYREVFRMSQQYDKPTKDKPYAWRLHLVGDTITHDKIKEQGLYVRSRTRKEGEQIRFVAGPGESHEKGEGNFPHPVIYLGLNRLSPLALCNQVEISNPQSFTSEEKKWIADQYRNILILTDGQITAQFVHSNDKTKSDFLGPKGQDYDAESCSAGQDNLGQILTALLSFKRLQKKMGNRYQGGLLLIDEVDATLHPVAQEKLFELLIRECKDLDLQIIATTHSLYLLHLALTLMSRDIELIYLVSENGQVAQKLITAFQQIEDDLQQRLRPTTRRKRTKPTILLEDGVAKDFLSYLIGTQTAQCFPIGSANYMSTMAGMNIPELKKVLFVIDGDKNQSVKGRPLLIALPGNTFPEKILFDFLHQLPESDDFFSNLRKRSLFRDYPTGVLSDRQYKNWYQKHRTHFGTNARLAFERWGKAHQAEIKEFLDSLIRIIQKNQLPFEPLVVEAILRRHGLLDS